MIRRRSRFKEPMASLNVKITGEAKAKLFHIAGCKSLGTAVEELIYGHNATVTLQQRQKPIKTKETVQ